MVEFSTVSSGGTISSSDHNAILDHAFDKAAAFVVRVNGVEYEAIKGGGPTGTGMVTYGGSGDAGGITGTDAHDVIEAAFGGLTSGRTWKEKVLLKGSFTIDDTLDVPSYTIVETDGKITLDNSIEKSIFVNDDVANGNTDIVFLGGVLDGNKANNFAGAAYSGGIILKGCTRVLVDNVTFVDNYSNAFSTDKDGANDKCEEVVVRNCFVRGCNGDSAIRMFNCDYFSATGNKVDGCYVGIWCTTSQYGLVANNVIRDGNGADNLNGGIGNGQGVSVSTSSSYIDVADNIIVNMDESDTDQTGGYGVQVNASREIAVEGNNITLCESEGIYTAGATSYCIFSGNIVHNNARGGAQGTYSEVKLNCTTGYHVFVGNTVLETGTRQCDYLVNVLNGSSDHNIIQSNMLSGVPVANMVNLATATNFVRHNKGYLTENSGSDTVASGTTSKAVAHGLGLTPSAEHFSVIGKENPTNDVGTIWVDTIGAANFTVNVENDPGASNWDFGWKVMVD